MTNLKEGYKNTELGIIPEEWRVKELNELGEIITGSTPKTSETDNYGSDYCWVSPADLGKSKYINNTIKKLSPKGYDKTRKLPKGTILVTCIGSTIGKIGILNQAGSTNQQINSIVCNSSVDSEFVYYSIDFNFIRYIPFISTQAVPIINKAVFSKFEIPVPPLYEQKRIAEILSIIDEHIEKLGKTIDEYEILKKGMIQKLLTEGIGHTEFKETELGRIPKSWEVSLLNNEIWYQEGPGLRKWQFTTTGIKVINVTNLVGKFLDLSLTERYISLDEYEQKYKHFSVDIGDIVIASSGNSWGKVSIVREQDLPLLMNTSVIRFKSKGKILQDYLYQYLLSSLFKDQIKLMITGSAQPNFGPYHLDRTFIIIPPLSEQQRIAEILSQIDERINIYLKQREGFIQLKKAIANQLLTGKKRVNY